MSIVRYTIYEGETRLDPCVPDDWGVVGVWPDVGVWWTVWHWDIINSVFQVDWAPDYTWVELQVSVSAPWDMLMKKALLQSAVEEAFRSLNRGGYPIRATMWYKWDGSLWQYVIFVEFLEGPTADELVWTMGVILGRVVPGIDFLAHDHGSTLDLLPPSSTPSPPPNGNGITTSNILPFVLLGGAALLAIYAMRES